MRIVYTYVTTYNMIKGGSSYFLCTKRSIYAYFLAEPGNIQFETVRQWNFESTCCKKWRHVCQLRSTGRGGEKRENKYIVDGGKHIEDGKKDSVGGPEVYVLIVGVYMVREIGLFWFWLLLACSSFLFFTFEHVWSVPMRVITHVWLQRVSKLNYLLMHYLVALF